MSFRPAAGLLAILLVSVAACDDTTDGGGTGGSGGSGAGGGETAVSTGTTPWGPTSGGEPLRWAHDICSDACACDATCLEQEDLNVADCTQRFVDDQSAATRTGCMPQYEAYYGCFSARWTCGDPGACDAEIEAFDSCVSSICDTANELCGCPGCTTECRGETERCWSTCVVEAGSCNSSDASYYACIDACYADEQSSSVGAGGWAAADE